MSEWERERRKYIFVVEGNGCQLRVFGSAFKIYYTHNKYNIFVREGWVTKIFPHFFLAKKKSNKLYAKCAAKLILKSHLIN